MRATALPYRAKTITKSYRGLAYASSSAVLLGWAKFLALLVSVNRKDEFMAQKLYVSGLRIVAGESHRYATRYQAQLQANLTPTQYTALLAFITCVAQLLADLGKQPVNP